MHNPSCSILLFHRTVHPACTIQRCFLLCFLVFFSTFNSNTIMMLTLGSFRTAVKTRCCSLLFIFALMFNLASLLLSYFQCSAQRRLFYMASSRQVPTFCLFENPIKIFLDSLGTRGASSLSTRMHFFFPPKPDKTLETTCCNSEKLLQFGEMSILGNLTAHNILLHPH